MTMVLNPGVSPSVRDVFLQPGGYCLESGNTRIRTLLGSCVALVLWHPERLLGGMCHYLLPGRARSQGITLDGRYADEAVELLLEQIRTAGTRPQDYQARLFGGGRMFDRLAGEVRGGAQVQERNVDAGRTLVRRHGFPLKAEHLGGDGHRQVILDVRSGEAWLKHTPHTLQTPCADGPNRR